MSTPNSNPKISVILPTRNGERYLMEAIASCQAQTEKNWEMILVDDGSDDSTPDLVDEAAKADPRISAFHIQQQFKLPGAMNFGSHKATGTYHYWLCDDDRLLPDAFAKLAKVLDENSDIGLVYADHWMINENGNRTRIIKREPYYYLLCCNVVGLCRMYRSQIFEGLGEFSNDSFLMEDYDFWLRAAEHHKFYLLREALMEVRFHSDSLTTSHYEACQHARIRMLAKNFNKPKGIPAEWVQQGALATAKDAWKFGHYGTSLLFTLKFPLITPLGFLRAISRKLRGQSFLPPAPDQRSL